MVLVTNATNQSLSLYSTETSDEILRIEKTGDYGIESVAFNGRIIAYSDAKETQVYAFDSKKLKLVKLTRKLCSTNGL